MNQYRCYQVCLDIPQRILYQNIMPFIQNKEIFIYQLKITNNTTYLLTTTL